LYEIREAQAGEIGQTTLEGEAAFGLSPFQIGMLAAGLLAGAVGVALLPSHPILGFITCLWTISTAWALYPSYPVISLSIVLIVGGLLILIR
jgi:hypothetical protein